MQFLNSDFNSLGVICKTQPQADALYNGLKDDFDLNLLNAASVAFGSGIVITTAYLAKGPEFYNEVVTYGTVKNYCNEPYRQMLYVACIPAMHKLSLTHTGAKSHFLKNRNVNPERN